MQTAPFTYSVRFVPTGQYYYGYHGRKGCRPDDLWTKYFTSSKIVRELIKIHGLGAFEIKIRRTFTSSSAARAWERKLLVRVDARNNPKMLNQSNGGKGFTLQRHTPETRQKISDARRGMKFTAEHRENIGAASRGRTPSLETKKKISDALTGRVVRDDTKAKLAMHASKRTHSSETRRKIGEAGKGRTLTKEAIERRPSNKGCIAEGITFTSLSEAARALGLSSSDAVKYRIKTGREGYSFL